MQVSACNLIKKEALAEMFSSEFFEIFKKIFFMEHLLATVSVHENPGLYMNIILPYTDDIPEYAGL